MRHHPDEFSVTDFRHTLEEAWRVVRHRRWFFVFPFCITSFIALIGSLWVPRMYTARTVVKREQDPVFATMMGMSWTQPYGEIRDRMINDLQDPDMIGRVLADLGLPAGLERFENGELSPRSRAAQQALAGQVARGLAVESLESSATSDVVAVTLTLSDAALVSKILAPVRDRYIDGARDKTVAVLRDVESFFRTESERCRSQLEALQQRMAEMELTYPGLDPEQPDATRTEQAELFFQRATLEREIDELESSRRRLAKKLAGGSEAGDEKAPLADEGMVFEPNPRHAELTREINKLLRQIADKKTLRGMTEQHPEIRQLRNTVAVRQSELTQVPEERRVIVSPANERTDKPDGPSRARQAEIQLADMDAKISHQRSRLAAIHERITQIERSRIRAVEPRQDYLKLKQQAEHLNEELQSWQENLGPLQSIFLMEDRGRTISFATVQDVGPVSRPSSPNARPVTLVCLGIGAAMGLLSVLLAEVLDRSYRTVLHLKNSLALPVIESIDEIVTATARRRLLIRSFVLLPAAACLCVAAMVIAGALAYFSLADPSRYELLRSVPSRAYQSLTGQA